MYPGAELDPPGGDCSGVVLSSSGTSSLAPGTPVFGLASGCLGTLVHCAPDTLVPMPAQLSFEQAATMPTVFMTAFMAFSSASAVQPGEKVLVHAAAGGVGLAAIQVLREMGAIAVTTAGGPPKRALLRSLGVAHVAGSRDTAFVEELAIGASGVDVLLNTLTSPGLVSAALSLLSHGGRFVEISKRDIWHASRAAQERPDLSFGMVAVDFLPGPAVQRAMSRVAAGAASGALRPLPIAAHSLRSVSAALRQMSQARHVGKVVVAVEDPLRQAQGSRLMGLGSSGGRVVVSGGLGALGQLMAGWLALSGVRHIELLSRSGRSAATAAAPSADLCQVSCLACDMGSAEDVASLLSSRSPFQLPISCVLHAGGVLADAMLRNQTLAGLRAVLAPKVSSLERWTASAKLHPSCGHVLFSSVASLLGSPGQVNYSAANSALDTAATALSVAGVPAVSMQWGAWAGGGMAAGDAQTAARVERMGMALLQPQQGLAALGAAISHQTCPVLAAVPFRWGVFLRNHAAQQGRGPRPAPASSFFSAVSAAVGSAEQAALLPKSVGAVGTRAARPRHVHSQEQARQMPQKPPKQDIVDLVRVAAM